MLYLLQQWLDALHARPNPRRLSQSTDVLWSLSCALSLTELLLMIPSHVTSLCICCPPVMRIIPWQLLQVEIPGVEARNLKFADGVPIVNPFAKTLTPTSNIHSIDPIPEDDDGSLVQIHLSNP